MKRICSFFFLSFFLNSFCNIAMHTRLRYSTNCVRSEHSPKVYQNTHECFSEVFVHLPNETTSFDGNMLFLFLSRITGTFHVVSSCKLFQRMNRKLVLRVSTYVVCSVVRMKNSNRIIFFVLFLSRFIRLSSVYQESRFRLKFDKRIKRW